MREPVVIKKEIQDLDNIILNAKNLSAQFPNDNLLKVNIAQAEGRKKMLLSELAASHEFHSHPST